MSKKKILGILAIVFVLLVVSLGILTFLGIITKMAWASFLLGIIGKDVEVEELGNEAAYFEFQGLNIPDGLWQVAESENGLIIENGTATVGIKTIEIQVEDIDAYLSSKALELSMDFSSSGMYTYSETYVMCQQEAQIVVGESGSTNYLIMFWYMEDKVYTINALYEERADADEVVSAISCQKIE